MTAFHDTTVTILKHVLDEQTRDLTIFQHRQERADAGATPFAAQSFRNQVAELTAVAGDFRRLVTLVQAANAADAAGLPAVLTLDARAKTPEPKHDQVIEAAAPTVVDVHRAETINYVLNLVRGLHRTEADRATFYATQPHAISLENIARERSGHLNQLVNAIEAGLFDQLDAEATEGADEATEAFVDVADAERYARRDEHVNDRVPERTTLAEQLRARGAEQAAQDAEADAFHAQRRADEAEANGEYVDYDEAAAVRDIEREMAIEAGDDSELDRQVAEDDARFERAVWLAQQEAQDDAQSEGPDRTAHYGGMQCPGCPDCIGYADPTEADALDGAL